MGVRAERRKEMEARLEQVALDLVVSKGLEALSMHRLAKELGVTPGALYRYVESREALLAQLLVVVLGEIGEAARQAMQSSKPVERLWAACAVLCRHAEVAPHRFGLLAVVLAEPRVLVPEPAHAQSVMGALLTELSPIVTALDQAAERRELAAGAASERALVLFTALVGVLALRKQQRHGIAGLQVERLARELVATLLIGWGADPALLPETLSEVLS